MKWLWIPLLWLAATVVAVAVLYRLWRGHNVVLKGRWSPRFVRMVVIALVILGFGIEKAPAAPVPGRGAVDKAAGPINSEWPKTMTEEVVGAWLFHQQSFSPWAAVKREYVLASHPKPTAAADIVPPQAEINNLFFGGGGRLGRTEAPAVPNRFKTLVAKTIVMEKAGKLELFAPEVTLDYLNELEKAGLFDHWASAFLWRATKPNGDPKALTELYARLHRHACLTNALIQAQAQVKPFLVSPRAWMGKAGRPPGVNPNQFDHLKSGAAMLPAAVEFFPKSDAGTWIKDGLVVLAVNRNSSGLTLHRAGTKQEIKPGESFRFGRLDLIEVPAGQTVRVEHDWLGTIELSAGPGVTARSLPHLLPDEAKTKVKQAVAEALKGAEDPTTKLEKALPLAQFHLREALSQQTDLPGAPRLRLILSLFDDAVMPALAPAEKTSTMPGSPLGGLDQLDRDIAPFRR